MPSASGPFHFISTPPLWKRSIKIYPLRIKDQKCRHVPPHQKLPKFSFPFRKKAIFFQTPRKYLKDQRRRRRDPLRNDVQAPPQKISSIGGVWILNGMAQHGRQARFSVDFSRSQGSVFIQNRCSMTLESNLIELCCFDQFLLSC